MRARHLAALPLLAGLRLKSALVGEESGLRILLLHDVPPPHMAALDRLVGGLARRDRLTDPDSAAAFLAGDIGWSGSRVLLTFDDGFASNLTAATTILNRHGARALFFVCPGLMALPADRQRDAIAANIFDGKRHAGDLALMGWDDLDALAAAGHTIGNHTLSHRRLTRLSAAEITDEIAGAAAEIAARTGQVADWFAYPFGDIDSVNRQVTAEAARHHRFCRSGVRGLNRAGTPPLAVLADHVDLGDPWLFQQLVIEGGLDRRYKAARNQLLTLA